MKAMNVRLEGMSQSVNLTMLSVDELLGLGCTETARQLLAAGGFAASRVTEESKRQSMAIYASNQAALEEIKKSPLGYTVMVLEEMDSSLSEENARALFWHEVGHIELGHADSLDTLAREGGLRLKSGKVGLINVERVEIEADAYAIEKVGAHRLLAALIAVLRVQAVLVKRYAPKAKDIDLKVLEDNILAEFRATARYRALTVYAEGC